MIKYMLRNVTADELSFKVNPLGAKPETRFEIKPLFSREIRRSNENPRIHAVALSCKIENTPESPKPFDLFARMVGLFEVDDMNTDEDRRIFAVNATETIFPYLRAVIANLTADALIAPLQLPAVSGSTLFPEDRGPSGYTLNVDPKTFN